MYEKIQPLLENLHRNFLETQNNISEQGRVGSAGGRDRGRPSMPLHCLVWAGGSLAPRSRLDMHLGFCQLNLGQPVHPSLLGAPMPSTMLLWAHAVPAGLSSSLPPLALKQAGFDLHGKGRIPGRGYSLVKALEAKRSPGSSGCGEA